MNRILTLLAGCLIACSAFAQEEYVHWSHEVEKIENDLYKVTFTAKIAEGYHSYSMEDEISATEFLDCSVEGGSLEGEVEEIGKPKLSSDGSLYYEGKMQYSQTIRLNSDEALYCGTIYTDACKKGEGCHSEYYDFEISLKSR